MHRITAYVHYFFVPTFQVNSVFERFINPKLNDGSILMPVMAPIGLNNSGQVNGGSGGFIGTLADYLGLPVTQTSWIATAGTADYQESFNIDPFRVYQHIYNSYYRDQNLEPLDGADPRTSSLFLIQNHLLDQGQQYGRWYGTEVVNLFKLRKRAWAKDYFTSALPSPRPVTMC